MIASGTRCGRCRTAARAERWRAGKDIVKGAALVLPPLIVAAKGMYKAAPKAVAFVAARLR